MKKLYIVLHNSYTVFIPKHSIQAFKFLHKFAKTWYLFVVVVNNSYLNMYKVISHCGFGFYFSDSLKYWPYFHILGHLHVFFWKMSNYLPIFNWVILVFLLLSYRSFSYILEINSLSYIWLANIFSYFLGCTLSLLIVSLAMQNFLV